MDILNESLLPMEQRRIIDKAARLIRIHKREDFRRYVVDVLRGRRDPPDNKMSAMPAAPRCFAMGSRDEWPTQDAASDARFTRPANNSRQAGPRHNRRD